MTTKGGKRNPKAASIVVGGFSSVRKVAEQTGTTEDWWRRCIDARLIASYKLGALVRLLDSDVDEFLASCRREPADVGRHVYTAPPKAASRAA